MARTPAPPDGDPTAATFDLTGRLLVAMPGMGDPRFERAVIFMCAHSPDGSMGLIVNKPTPGVTIDALLDQLQIAKGPGSTGRIVHFGGPVEHGRGFVLHSGDYQANASTLRVTDRFGMTATLDILDHIARGSGPERSLLMLGYAGWGPGQVEDEIARNGWLVADATEALVFGPDDSRKWEAALRSLGIDPLLLSAAAGRA
ncbi:MAG: YqgE/AlgH family protein [Rhodobacteraceae bacterium]|jgi:putative transcriptional regulator|nr:YqgE/AlgH family protein [Paracoccaceae bacterium]